ncbi:MAG: hypothetical protein ACLTBV_21985 [Enterocloster bolteae]
MMEHFDELNTVGIGREEALEFAVLAERQRNFSPKQGLTVGLSSGTSGKQGIFLVSDDEKPLGRIIFLQGSCREVCLRRIPLHFS